MTYFSRRTFSFGDIAGKLAAAIKTFEVYRNHRRVPIEFLLGGAEISHELQCLWVALSEIVEKARGLSAGEVLLTAIGWCSRGIRNEAKPGSNVSPYGIQLASDPARLPEFIV